MKPATSLASLKQTSPTKRCPLFFVASGTALMPTSMIAAPGLIQSPRNDLRLADSRDQDVKPGELCPGRLPGS